ncbi:hypothetical protein EYY98_00845 [Obesumbacterium proteus]|nr:hypothetical protein EYY98_00845 [Obesumbacterium proteus]
MGDLGWKSDGNESDVRPPPSLPLHKGEEHTAFHVIASLHGMTTHFSDGETGGFRVEVRW